MPGAKKLTVFEAAIADSDEVKKLGDEVEAFAKEFPMPGFEYGKIRGWRWEFQFKRVY